MTPLIVKSGLKSVTTMNVGKDVFPALEARVTDVLKLAETRAAANGRKTIKAHDL